MTLLELGIKEIGMEFRNPSMCILDRKIKGIPELESTTLYFFPF